VRTTLNIDDELLEEARRMTGISEKSVLVREGLEHWWNGRALAVSRDSEVRARARTCSAAAVEPQVILVDTSVWIDHLRKGDSI